MDLKVEAGDENIQRCQWVLKIIQSGNTERAGRVCKRRNEFCSMIPWRYELHTPFSTASFVSGDS